MLRRSVITLVAIAFFISGTSQAFGGDYYQRSSTDFRVKQRLRIYYDGGTCNGEDRIKITAVASKYWREISNRKVSASHVTGVQDGRKCSDGSYLTNTWKTVEWHPVFGCGGRCGSNTTEELGFAPSWPAVMLLSGCDIPFCFIGGSAHGHVKRKDTGQNLGAICTKIAILAAAPGCQ